MVLLLVTAMCELNFFFFCAGERDEGVEQREVGGELNRIGRERRGGEKTKLRRRVGLRAERL